MKKQTVPGRVIAEMARITKRLDPEGLGLTYHFYLSADKKLYFYEDVSGQEWYPDDPGTYLMSANRPMTRAHVAECVAINHELTVEEAIRNNIIARFE